VANQPPKPSLRQLRQDERRAVMRLVTLDSSGKIVRDIRAGLLVGHLTLETGEVMFSWEHWFEEAGIPENIITPQFAKYGNDTRFLAEMRWTGPNNFGARIGQLMVRIESTSAPELQEVIERVIESLNPRLESVAHQRHAGCGRCEIIPKAERTLDHPLVKTMKEKFENSRAIVLRQCSLDFDELFLRFQDRRGWTEIAREAGVWEGAIRQCYRKYFQPIFGPRDLYAERSAQVQQDREMQKETAWKDDPHLRVIGESALAVGLSVRAVMSDNRTLTTVLDVEGKLCQVHVITFPFPGATQPRRRHYARTDVQKNQYEWRIFRTAVPGYPERVFIAPVKDILGLEEKRQVYLPLERQVASRGRHKPQIDWWAYENAWHLLVY